MIKLLHVCSKIKSLAALLLGLVLCTLASFAHASDTPDFSISNAAHRIVILDQSAPALKKRIDMIRGAKQSIEIESWNFDMSLSSRLLLRELIAKKAADPSISIRLIVDYYVSGGLAPINPSIARALTKLGIEVRYYNQVSKLNFFQLDHRDHCKLFIVDNEEFIIGSRNLSDEHFGLGKGLNYVDVDLWVRGPMAIAVQNSFDEYWNSPIVKEPTGNFSGSKPDALFFVDDQDRALAEKVETLGSRAIENSPIYQVSHLTYVKDGPLNDSSERKVTDYVNSILSEVNRSLIVENWGFIPDDRRLSILSGLMARKIPIHLLTNGFDDHFSRTLSNLAWVQEQKEINKGLSMYYYTAPSDEPHLDDSIAALPSIHETHSKTTIRDRRYVDVGSYNWDGRSAYTNHEDLLTVDNPELAVAMIKIIRNRVARSEKISADGKRSDGQSVLPPYLQGAEGWLNEHIIGVEGEVAGQEF